MNLTVILCFNSIMSYAYENKGQLPPIDTINVSEKWVALIPVIFYLLILIMVFWKLRKDKVTLKELLLDKDAMMEVEIQKNKQQQEIAKTASGVDNVSKKAYLDQVNSDSGTSSEEINQKSSVSRLLAFISGLVSVGIACAITTFYMWNYFDSTGDKKLDLNQLLTVLLSLGIGVIPYAFNKIGNALKNP